MVGALKLEERDGCRGEDKPACRAAASWLKNSRRKDKILWVLVMGPLGESLVWFRKT